MEKMPRTIAAIAGNKRTIKAISGLLAEYNLKDKRIASLSELDIMVCGSIKEFAKMV